MADFYTTFCCKGLKEIVKLNAADLGVIMKEQNEQNKEVKQCMDLYSNDDRQYLQMMQDNIARMANNSANCKTWMVTLVAGLCAIGCSISKLNGWIFLTIIPVVVFWYLDTFYLNLERKMRNRELDFIHKMKNDYGFDAYKNALYNFSPLTLENLSEEEKNNGFVDTSDRAFSMSIFPFYFMMIVAIIIITIVLNWPFCK